MFILGVVIVAISILLIRSSNRNIVKLTIIGEQLPTTDAMKKRIPEFELWFRENHGFPIQVKFITDNYETMNQKTNDDLVKGASRYDLILQYNTALSTYVQKEYVYTLQDETYRKAFSDLETLEKRLIHKAWQEVGWYRHKDSTYVPIGLPFATNTMLLCYNKRLFANHREAYRKKYKEELNPPTTWNQFENIAQYFSSQPNLYGIVMQGKAPYWIYFEWANYVFGMGGGVMQKNFGWDTTKDTPILLNSKATLEATKFYKRMQQYNVGEDSFFIDNLGQRERMQTGDVAMAIMWSDVAFDLVSGFQKELSSDEFGFVPIPGSVSMLAGGSFYVNKKTKHLQEAVAFIEWILQPENQVKLLSDGLCSPVFDAYEDTQAKQLPYVEALKESLKRGVYMLEAGPEADQIEVILSNNLQSMLKGDIEPQQMLFNTSLEIESLRNNMFDRIN
ncbi:MAG: extracellular solute-binding protein [Proteobacteria bacterium]|nr:extracellular solute-binding protein [Pseudomonadota bacterium]